MDRERRATPAQLTARITADVTLDARKASGWDTSVRAMRVLGDRTDPDGSWIEVTTPDGDTITVDYYPHGTVGVARMVRDAARAARRSDGRVP